MIGWFGSIVLVVTRLTEVTLLPVPRCTTNLVFGLSEWFAYLHVLERNSRTRQTPERFNVQLSCGSMWCVVCGGWCVCVATLGGW